MSWLRPWVRFASTASAASSDLEVELARKWLKTLNANTVPRHLGEVSFSRSSGPGGQNVNKVNSKATLKIPLAILLPLVPRLLHPQLRASRHATERSQALVFQSDESRKQASNVDSCFDKLHQLLESAARAVVPGDTSEQQRNRVRKLQKAENEARLKSKKMHGSKKQSRRGTKDD